MDPELIRQKLVAALGEAEVDLEDLTGTRDHWKARIVSPRFAGLSHMQRHRLVNIALADELKGPIHALSMDTLAPGE